MSAIRILSLVFFLGACPAATDAPCGDLSEEACRDDARCEVEYLESCGCSCADEGCGGGCCEFGACVEAG